MSKSNFCLSSGDMRRRVCPSCGGTLWEGGGRGGGRGARDKVRDGREREEGGGTR